jgi:hypothetical protein
MNQGYYFRTKGHLRRLDCALQVGKQKQLNK